MPRLPPTPLQLAVNREFVTEHYELIRELSNKVWFVKSKATYIPVSQDDFFQQVYLKLLLTRSTYTKDRGSPSSYIYIVAYSCFIDYMRKQNSLYPPEMDFHTTIEDLVSQEDSDSEEINSEPFVSNIRVVSL